MIKSFHPVDFRKQDYFFFWPKVARLPLLLQSSEHLYLSLQVCNFIKKKLQHKCFPVNFAIFKNIFLIEHLRWLLLFFLAQFLILLCLMFYNFWQKLYEHIYLLGHSKSTFTQNYQFLNAQPPPCLLLFVLSNFLFHEFL